MKKIGPVKIVSSLMNEEVYIPLATLEAPLWPSAERGARVSRLAGGIRVSLVQEGMTRSILLEADWASQIHEVIKDLPNHEETLQKWVQQTSRFVKLTQWHPQVVGSLLYLRLSFSTGDAAGHNMATKASEAVMNWLLSNYAALRYVSISANVCTDKKASAINGILGRGKYVVAEMVVPRAVCEENLRATPEAIVNLIHRGVFLKRLPFLLFFFSLWVNFSRSHKLSIASI
jgi:hydroxymethylglutaryl-CoA reductase (NADPH)